MGETKFEKFKNGIINSIGFIVVGAVVVVFMAKNFVEIGESGKTVSEIVADGIFALVFGWAIKMLLGYQGVLSGMNSKKVLDTLNQQATAIKKIECYLPLLPKFCDRENAELRIKRRKLILSKELLNYEDVFCDDPSRLDAVIEEKLANIRDDTTRIDAKDLRSKLRQTKVFFKRKIKKHAILRCVRKANNVHFAELTQHALTTDGGRNNNPFKFPEPIAKHISKKAILSLPISFLFAIVFGYYGYRLVDNPTWATVIGGLIQIGSFLSVGTLSFLKEYLYSTDTYRKGTVRKIDILERFYAEAQADNTFVVPVEIIKTEKSKEAQAAREEIDSSNELQTIPGFKEN